MQIQQFMEENDIAIFVKADLNTTEFEIIHGKMEIESMDLFEQLILSGSVEKLQNSIQNQIMPRIWSQGNTKCVVCKPNESYLIALFFDTMMEMRDLYFHSRYLDFMLTKVINNLR